MNHLAELSGCTNSVLFMVRESWEPFALTVLPGVSVAYEGLDAWLVLFKSSHLLHFLFSLVTWLFAVLSSWLVKTFVGSRSLLIFLFIVQVSGDSLRASFRDFVDPLKSASLFLDSLAICWNESVFLIYYCFPWSPKGVSFWVDHLRCRMCNS